jgi:hypothetical protein
MAIKADFRFNGLRKTAVKASFGQTAAQQADAAEVVHPDRYITVGGWISQSSVAGCPR